MTIKSKTRAVLVGALILIAYGVLISEMTDSRPTVMIADVISGLAVIGIAVLMFPLFKERFPKLNYGYLAARFMEGVLMVAGGFLFLSESTEHFRDDIYDGIHLYTFIIGGFLFYYLLVKTKLIPKFISIWGLVAMLALLIQTIFGWFGMESAIIDAMLVLIITNEVFLAIWLMVKGFRIKEK